MARQNYGIYIGTDPLARDKELINPNKRDGMIPPEETIISASYVAETNTAGSCEFIIPYTHPYYNDIVPMVTEVVVAEIDNVVWFGRVTDFKMRWDKAIEVHCEGALAYLNDSVQPYEKYYNLTPEQLLAKIIANHNRQVPMNRNIALSDISIPNPYNEKHHGEFNYESSMDAVQNLISEYEGYLYTMMGLNGEATLYWITKRDLVSTQDVQFGSNLLDLRKNVDYTDICTCIMPCGENVEMEFPDLDYNGVQIYEDSDGNQNLDENGNSLGPDASHNIPSTIIEEVPLNLGMIKDESVEPDDDGIAPERWIQNSTNINDLVIDNSSAVSVYGRIIRRITFSGVWNTDELREKATEWLAKQELNNIEIDISAADLRFLNSELGNFYIGMGVPVKSTPHGIQDTLVITRIEADILKVSKKITLGRMPTKSLSDIAGRNSSSYTVGPKIRKISSKSKISAKNSGLLLIPD